MNGTGFQMLVSEGQMNPTAIALDLDADKMYWCGAGRIRRANLDGTEPETLVSGLGFPSSIDIIPVPEPSTLVMVVLAGGLLHRRSTRSRTRRE
jgi:hypothetical protein